MENYKIELTSLHEEWDVEMKDFEIDENIVGNGENIVENR